jgi:peptidoglycan/xylan/chitin deacetylase (PgdA/CDA1 family)
MIRVINKAVYRLDRMLCRAITRVSVDEPILALTFDDGPDTESTPLYLDFLKRHHVKATFLVVGERAAQYSEFITKIADDGHEIGNHSWGHQSFTAMRWFQQVISLQRYLIKY